VEFTLTKPTLPDPPTIANFKVSSSNTNLLTCTGGCGGSNVTFGADEDSKNFTAKLKAKSNLQGQGDQQVNFTIEASGAQPVSQAVTIEIPEAPPSVPAVSGRVENVLDASPIGSANVYMQDSTNRNFGPVRADKNGNFKFTSTAAKPIAPGVLAFTAEKDGWDALDLDQTGTAGQPLTGVKIKMKSLASASASAPPTSAGAEASTDAAATGEGTAPISGESGGFSWWLIIVGGLLVAIGVGAIVLLLLRRRGDDDDAPDDDPSVMGGPRGRPGAPPARAGGPRGPQRRPEPTTVMRRPEPVGARGADPTMITRSPLADRPRQPAGPPMDNPTMVHGRIPGDSTDPYATGPRPVPGTPPPGGGYGGPGGYAPPPQAGAGYDGGYGAGPGGAPTAYPPPSSQPSYPPPTSPAGYPPPSAAGGYPPATSPAGYPTGEYNPGYGQQAQGGYQTPSYGDQYGGPPQPPARSGGYGADGYGQTGGPAAGSYGGQHGGGGYGGDQPTGGYDAYGSQGGHGQEAPQGYDEYDQRQSRHGQRPTPPQPGERRLDWLDD
jgi:hypothetical protein